MCLQQVVHEANQRKLEKELHLLDNMIEAVRKVSAPPWTHVMTQALCPHRKWTFRTIS